MNLKDLNVGETTTLVKAEEKISFKNKQDLLKQLGDYASHEDNSWNSAFLKAVIDYCKKNLK